MIWIENSSLSDKYELQLKWNYLMNNITYSKSRISMMSMLSKSDIAAYTKSHLYNEILYH